MCSNKDTNKDQNDKKYKNNICGCKAVELEMVTNLNGASYKSLYDVLQKVAAHNCVFVPKVFWLKEAIFWLEELCLLW